MNNLAKEINSLLLEDENIIEYLNLKKQVEEDKELSDLYKKIDSKRKEICKNKDMDSNEYYKMLDLYNKDNRVMKLNRLKREIQEYLSDISDILSLK